MLSGLLLIVGVALAGDVLVPTYTPATMSDFAPSERLTEETLKALSSRDVAFVAPSEIQRRAGEVADGCSDVPDCADTLWRHFGTARLAVIGAVTWDDGMLKARVRFHGPDDASPIEVLTDTFPEDELPIFAGRVADSARDLLGLVPPREGGGVALAREPKTPDRAELPPPEPEGREERYDLDTPQQEEPVTAQQDELERRSRGMPKRAWKQYRASGLSYEDWTDRALVRAGAVVIEFHGGAVFGDVDRSYDVRASVEQIGTDSDAKLTQTGTYQHETFVTGSTFMLGGSIGYVPVWWLEADLFGGFSLAEKDLSTGWTLYKDGVKEQSETNDYDPATAFLGIAEPRLRLLTMATGPVKPYVLLAASLRFYDVYTVPDLDTVVYPDREGGLGLGFTGGGGIAFDAPGAFTGFLEVPWTFHITPQPFTVEDEAVVGTPDKPARTGQTLAFRAGIGFRL
jgi:hypothetical protein